MDDKLLYCLRTNGGCEIGQRFQSIRIALFLYLFYHQSLFIVSSSYSILSRFTFHLLTLLFFSIYPLLPFPRLYLLFFNLFRTFIIPFLFLSFLPSSLTLLSSLPIILLSTFLLLEVEPLAHAT